MGLAKTPPQVRDEARLATLRRTGLLDSGPEESFERLGGLARNLTGAPTALVSLVAEDRQHFKCCLGLAEPFAAAGETPLSHSICQYALVDPGPLVIADTSLDKRLIGNRAVEDLGAAAYLGVPLIGRHGHVLGSFCVLDDHPRQWTEVEIKAMQDLAASVMTEIELRELTSDQGKTNRELSQSEGQLRATIDGLYIFASLLGTDGTVIDANSAALDAAGLALDDVVGQRFWDTHWWSWDETVQEQLAVAVARAVDGKTSRYDTMIRLEGDRLVPIDFQLAPLIENGEVVRLISSGLDITERKQFEHELTRLASGEAKHRQQAEDLLQLSRALGSAVTVGAVAGAVASIGTVVAGAAFANVAITIEGSSDLELHHNDELDRSIIDRWPRIPRNSDTPLGACMISGQSVLLGTPEEIAARYPIGAEDSEAAGFRAMAALPTPGAEAAIGFAWTDPIDFDGGVADTLGVVAELVGQALTRASLHDRDRQIAQRLQTSLLPQQLPSIPGAHLTAHYEAGGSSSDVGGDWYDVVKLDDERWVLAAGDVVGRGLNAAVTMGQLRNSFAALATNSAHLSMLIDRLDLAASDLQDAQFSTMVAVEYSVVSGQISVVSAGHPPPLIRRKDGRIEQLEANGRPLGVAHGREREMVRDTLGEGDLLFLYTDGLVERRSESIDVGLDRLAARLTEIDPVNIGDLCVRLHAAVQPDSTDDVAMLALLISS